MKMDELHLEVLEMMERVRQSTTGGFCYGTRY